jgi:hypothetical protein
LSLSCLLCCCWLLLLLLMMMMMMLLRSEWLCWGSTAGVTRLTGSCAACATLLQAAPLLLPALH